MALPCARGTQTAHRACSVAEGQPGGARLVRCRAGTPPRRGRLQGRPRPDPQPEHRAWLGGARKERPTRRRYPVPRGHLPEHGPTRCSGGQSRRHAPRCGPGAPCQCHRAPARADGPDAQGYGRLAARRSSRDARYRRRADTRDGASAVIATVTSTAPGVGIMMPQASGVRYGTHSPASARSMRARISASSSGGVASVLVPHSYPVRSPYTSTMSGDIHLMMRSRPTTMLGTSLSLSCAPQHPRRTCHQCDTPTGFAPVHFARRLQGLAYDVWHVLALSYGRC